MNALKGDLTLGTWGFCTNGSGWTKKEGLELIGLGPGDPMMSHQPNEWCPIVEMELVCEVFKGFIGGLVNGLLVLVLLYRNPM